MSYQPNIPQSNQLLSLSQLDLLTNFGQLNSKFGIDHVPYSPAVANSGKHNKATLIKQVSDPATGANEGVIYTKLIGSDLVPVYRDQSNGTITPLLSASTAAATGQVNIGSIVLKWGYVTTSNATYPVTFSPAFANNCFNVQITNAFTTVSSAYATDVSATGFTAHLGGSTSKSFYWIAIGN